MCALSRLISPCLWRNQKHIHRCRDRGPPLGSPALARSHMSGCHSPRSTRPGRPGLLTFQEKVHSTGVAPPGSTGSEFSGRIALPDGYREHDPLPEWPAGPRPRSAPTACPDGVSLTSDGARAGTRFPWVPSQSVPPGQALGSGASGGALTLGRFLSLCLLTPGEAAAIGCLKGGPGFLLLGPG